MHLDINSASDFERTKGGVLIPPILYFQNLKSSVKSTWNPGPLLVSPNSSQVILLVAWLYFAVGRYTYGSSVCFFLGLQGKQQVAVLHSKFPVFLFFLTPPVDIYCIFGKATYQPIQGGFNNNTFIWQKKRLAISVQLPKQELCELPFKKLKSKKHGRFFSLELSCAIVNNIKVHPQSFWVEWLSPTLGFDLWFRLMQVVLTPPCFECSDAGIRIVLLRCLFFSVEGPGHSTDEDSVGIQQVVPKNKIWSTAEISATNTWKQAPGANVQITFCTCLVKFLQLGDGRGAPPKSSWYIFLFNSGFARLISPRIFD